MCRSFCFLAALVLLSDVCFAQANAWRAGEQPQIIGNTGIITGGSATTGGSQIQGERATIVVQVGQDITLRATAEDEDDRPNASGSAIIGFDATSVIWTKTNGELQHERTNSGEANRFTAPETPQTVTVTAQADDTDATTRFNDDPGETVSLTIKVVDGCPDGINFSDDSCVGAPSWRAFGTFGKLFAKMCVMGGTPPADPDDPAAPRNWNGLQVREVLALNATATTCVNADFKPTITLKNTFCNGTATFTVGSGGSTQNGCLNTPTDNCFYDLHKSTGTGTILTALWLRIGRAPCQVVCNQEYFCKEGDGVDPLAKFRVTRMLSHEGVEGIGVRVPVAISKVAR